MVLEEDSGVADDGRVAVLADAVRGWSDYNCRNVGHRGLVTEDEGCVCDSCARGTKVISTTANTRRPVRGRGGLCVFDLDAPAMIA